MPLTVRDNNGGSEGYMGNGLFVDEAEIVELKNTSGQTSQFQKFANDLSMEIKVRMTKNGWDKTFNLGGNFTKDKMTGEVNNWGGAFKVRDFFIATGQKSTLEVALPELERGQIPEAMMDNAIGTTILILSYRNKKDKTSTWNQVFPADKDKESVKNYFLKEWEKSKTKNNGPFPSNYKADGEESDDFNFGANAETTADQSYGNL